MLTLDYARWLSGAVLFACSLFYAGICSAATNVGVVSATVMPSPLSASVALYVRTARAASSMTGYVAAPGDAWSAAAKPTSVNLEQDGTAQFTMFGDTASNYAVRLNDAAYVAWPDRMGFPIVLEPTLNRGGRLSIVVSRAPSSMFADEFQVVINYN